MNTAVTVSGIVLGIIGVLSLLGTVVSRITKRSADERELSLALQDNTKATTALSAKFEDYAEKTTKAIHHLDTRVTVIEKLGHVPG